MGFCYKLCSSTGIELYAKVLGCKLYSMIIYNNFFVSDFFLQRDNALHYIKKKALRLLMHNIFRMYTWHAMLLCLDTIEHLRHWLSSYMSIPRSFDMI
jgi:hypothetical protein